jgi:DNA ligase-associated metallophosphoesterase
MNPINYSTEQKHAKIQKIRLLNQELWCDHRGITWIPQWRALIVSDLHLEKGSSFAKRGVMLPPYDTAATLNRLQSVVNEYVPEIVICLGDSFHDDEGSIRLLSSDRERISSMAGGRQWFWISGNHDKMVPRDLPGEGAVELSLGGLIFRHIPDVGAIGEISGHLHPAARIIRRGRSVRRPCFAADESRLVMPAFGSFTGTLNVLNAAYDGLFTNNRPTAYLLGRKTVYRIGANLLQPG